MLFVENSLFFLLGIVKLEVKDNQVILMLVPTKNYSLLTKYKLYNQQTFSIL